MIFMICQRNCAGAPSGGFPLGVPAAHMYNFELTGMYVTVLTYFSATGAGLYSIDKQVFRGELNLYKLLWEKVSGKSE